MVCPLQKCTFFMVLDGHISFMLSTAKTTICTICMGSGGHIIFMFMIAALAVLL